VDSALSSMLSVVRMDPFSPRLITTSRNPSWRPGPELADGLHMDGPL
jgi:hypothetical protein